MQKLPEVSLKQVSDLMIEEEQLKKENEQFMRNLIAVLESQEQLLDQMQETGEFKTLLA